MVRSKAWFRPTFRFGSTWNENTSGNVTTVPLMLPHGRITGLDCVCTTGTGMVPSNPTRKLFTTGLVLVATQPAPPAPVALHLGVVTLMVCPNATPSDGMTTL